MAGRHTKKGIVLLLVMVLAMVSVLAACSSKSESGNEPPKESPKVSLLLSHANAPYTKAVTNWDDNEYVKELEKLSGFDLHYEFLGHTPDFIPQLTTRFASGNLADLMRTEGIESSSAPGAVDAGAFTELGPLIDKFAPGLKKAIPQSAWDSPRVSKNGKIYGIPAMLEPSANRVVYIRQDWLDKFGMKAPSTLNEWVAYFEAVKKNDKDAIPFVVRENMGFSEMFFGAFGVSPSNWTLVNGKYTPDMIRPEMKEAIKFWKMLYDKGYVNNNMFTNKAADWTASINQGKAGSWIHDATNYSASFVNQMVDKSAKISMIPGPVGAKGEKGLYAKTDGIYFVFVLPTKSKNQEAAIKYLEWAWTNPDAQKFWSFGIKNINYKETAGKIEWDAETPRNKENSESFVYRASLNPTGVASNAESVIRLDPNGETILKGVKAAGESAIITQAINLPVPTPFKTSPELVNGFGAGTLFLDMFAKVVTGKEELDKAFDAFVAEWTKRGGDKAIVEATEWYNKSVKTPTK